jgi:hypothetical protein
MDMFYCWIMWFSLEVDVEEDLVHAADYSGCCPTRPPFSSKQHALVGCTGDYKGTARAAVGFLVGFHPAATHMPEFDIGGFYDEAERQSLVCFSNIGGVWNGLALLARVSATGVT